jgi:hypothetical protein
MNPQRDETGKLPAYAWPGGYPVFYICADNGVLCPNCANTEPQVLEADRHAECCRAFEQWRIVAGDVNWEDNCLTCDHCNQRIESAYAEEKGGAQ